MTIDQLSAIHTTMCSDTTFSQHVQQILWVLPDPIMAVDSSFQVEYINSAFEKMFDASLAQIQGKDLHEAGLGAGEDWESLMRKLRNFSSGNLINIKAKSPGGNETRELLIDPLMPKNSFNLYHDRPKISLDGKIYSYEIFKVLDPNNSSSLSVVLFREITKDIENSDQIVQAEKMSGLGTLAAGLAHELNNPLYTIIGFSEMILKESNKVKIDSIARRIREKSQSLAAIVENLNSYIQSNPIDGHMTVNINERLDAALEMALLVHGAKNLTTHKNYSPLPFFKARSDEIQQIFFNIFSNSIQAMNGNGDLDIRSINVNQGKGIVVTIRDTGVGVPKEYIAKVFDPFFTTKDQGEGTGLGLTAVYQLVKKYGGKIKFNSVQGEGAEVEIYWPVKQSMSI